jgi:hypothetical protein
MRMDDVVLVSVGIMHNVTEPIGAVWERQIGEAQA